MSLPSARLIPHEETPPFHRALFLTRHNRKRVVVKLSEKYWDFLPVCHTDVLVETMRDATSSGSNAAMY